MMTKFINNKKIYFILSVLVGLLGNILSFWLAYKRFANFEFGKFDLGNMSQLVWNTSQGRIFEVTDQFGSTASRLAMSHFDPILLLFAPLFWISSNPMILVFAQHIILWSAVIPIFWLVEKKTNSSLLGLLVVVLYSIQPSLGYLLVWTEIHGITVAAGLFFWFIWYLENTNYEIIRNKRRLSIYLVMLIVILSGKEEIGAILAIYSIYIFTKDKKLGILTFLVSTVWFIISFFVLIPSYSHIRDQSIDSFFSSINFENPKPEDAAGDNFFYLRYSYLGNSYPEMLANLILKPQLVGEIVLLENNGLTLINLFAPLGFIHLVMPVWLAGLPDYLITLLSFHPLFSITNHRLSFVFVTLFISFIYFVIYLHNKNLKLKYASYAYVFFCLILSLLISFSSKNPLLIPIQNRLKIDIPSSYAKDDKKFEYKKVYKSEQPENSLICLEHISKLILESDPQQYTGPDYLGAKTSLRPVNALFPTALESSDMFVADFYEDKAYEPLDAVNTWTVNKDILSNTLKSGKFRHISSCGRMILFERADNGLQDNSEIVPVGDYDYLDLSTKNMGVNVHIVSIPNSENGYFAEYILNRQPEINLNDKVFYWRIHDRSKDQDYYLIDYGPLGLNEDLSGVARDKAVRIKRDMSFLSKIFVTSTDFDVFYGISNQINSVSIYLGSWKY